MEEMEHLPEMNWFPAPGNVTKWDVYFFLYFNMSIAAKKAERSTKPDELRALYGFILECYRELETKLPEPSNQVEAPENTQK